MNYRLLSIGCFVLLIASIVLLVLAFGVAFTGSITATFECFYSIYNATK